MDSQFGGPAGGGGAAAAAAAAAAGVSERLEAYIAALTPDQARLRKVYRGFIEEAMRGLEAHRLHPNAWVPADSSLMMLDTCVGVIPSGREKCVCYAVDFGGTNLRAIRVALNGQGQASMSTLKRNIRESSAGRGLRNGLLDRQATASMLFDEIADAVGALMKEKGDKDVQVGFTFSFGMNQKSIAAAILTGWSKDFETGMDTNDPVIGRDVGALLDAAFARRGVRAKVAAVLNDTVGAMLAGNYCKKPHEAPCVVGVILGTGLNGTYLQPNARDFGYDGLFINTECGGLNTFLPRCDVDLEVDARSTAPGRQPLEKMVAGMWLPEVVRLLVLRILQEQAPLAAWNRHSLTGDACGAILNDAAPFRDTETALLQLWDWRCPQHQLPVVHRIVAAVFARSAMVAAASVAAMAKLTGRLQPAVGGVTVGVDGTLYVNNKSYQRQFRQALELVLDKETADLINTVIATDGSGMGAAVLAAAIVSEKGH